MAAILRLRVANRRALRRERVFRDRLNPLEEYVTDRLYCTTCTAAACRDTAYTLFVIDGKQRPLSMCIVSDTYLRYFVLL